MHFYQPTDSDTRVVWYGGESTMLHFETLDPVTEEWRDLQVRTLGGGIPTGMKELQEELVDFYNYCHST